MGTVAGTGSVGTGQLVQHPRGGGGKALKVVLRSSNHCWTGNRRRVRQRIGAVGESEVDKGGGRVEMISVEMIVGDD